jgi:hypothetical protein
MPQISSPGAPKKHSFFSDLIAWSNVQEIKKDRGFSNYSATQVYAKRLIASGHDVTPGMVKAAVDRIIKSQKLTPKERSKLFEHGLEKFIGDIKNRTDRDDEAKLAPWLIDLKRKCLSGSEEQSIRIESKTFINLLNNPNR